MIVRRFFIVCPKGVATGGPEALHQLYRELTDQGLEALLWDPDRTRCAAAPAKAYEEYDPKWTEAFPNSQDVVIVPEVYGDLIPRLYLNCRIVFWWLSVDNFSRSSRITLDVLKVLFPDVIHCYQSEYARIFLQENGTSATYPLSDYLNEDFVSRAIGGSLTKISEDTLIAVNPAKGFDRTSIVLNALDPNCVIRLENMSRAEVIDSLAKADIYLDLGNHPGTDRIPREAALMNCVVLTNTRGSAGNDTDIPIDKGFFKFDDRVSNFEIELLDSLKEIRKNPKEYLEMQKTYRNQVLQGKEKFSDEVEDLVQMIANTTSHQPIKLTHNNEKVIRYIADITVQRDLAIHERDLAIHERDLAIHERDKCAHYFHELRNSFSWRLTGPIRFVGRKVSRFLLDSKI
jgi:hypothetical protein